MPPTRRAPDTTTAREALHRALRLLDDQEDPEALDDARRAAQTALDAIPYPWRAPHRNAKDRDLHEAHRH